MSVHLLFFYGSYNHWD